MFPCLESSLKNVGQYYTRPIFHSYHAGTNAEWYECGEIIAAELYNVEISRNRVSEYVHVIQTFIRTKDSLAVVVFIFLSFIQIEAVYLNH